MKACKMEQLWQTVWLSAREQGFAMSVCSLTESISFLLLLVIFIAQIYTQESRTFKSVQPNFKGKQKKRYKRETKNKTKRTKVQDTITQNFNYHWIIL